MRLSILESEDTREQFDGIRIHRTEITGTLRFSAAGVSVGAAVVSGAAVTGIAVGSAVGCAGVSGFVLHAANERESAAQSSRDRPFFFMLIQLLTPHSA